MEQPEDVEVALAHDREHRFHSSVLCRYSTLFEHLLTQENAARLSTRAKSQGVTTRFRIELHELPPAGGNVGKLRLMELDSMGRVTTDSAYGPMLPLNENGKVPLKLFEHYENIFGAYYGNDIIINDVTIATALEDAVGLIEVAEYLGSTAVVAKSIDIALFKQGQVLFRSIASKPDAWVDLAYRIKSELIFKESIIHLVGQWNGVGGEIKRHLPVEVGKVCEKHYGLLRERCKLVEMKVAAIYPSGIERTEPSQIRRENYANDVMIWISLSFFRHWFAQAIIAGRGSLNNDGGYALYKQLAAGGDKYMDKPIMNGFHERFAMTKKGQNVIENHLLEIKECIRQCIAQSGIMETESQLDTHKYEATYLTSVKIEKTDYPWVKDTNIARAVARRASKHVRDAEETDEEEVDVELDSDSDYNEPREQGGM